MKQFNHPIVVIDINVFVSGTIVSKGNSSKIMNAWREGYFELAISEPILEKMNSVYKYPRIQKYTKVKSNGEINEFINDIRESAIIISNLPEINISPDPEDNLIISCAIGANANYIVSGDKKHVLPIKNIQGIKILSPTEFIEELTLLSEHK